MHDTEHTERVFLLRRHLGNWPRSKHEKRTAGSAWETWTVAAADGVRCTRVRWEINLLLTFENAPFFCVYPVYTVILILSVNITFTWGQVEIYLILFLTWHYAKKSAKQAIPSVTYDRQNRTELPLLENLLYFNFFPKFCFLLSLGKSTTVTYILYRVLT